MKKKRVNLQFLPLKVDDVEALIHVPKDQEKEARALWNIFKKFRPVKYENKPSKT